MPNVRCNWCCTVMEETSDTYVFDCWHCGNDDYLMEPFEPLPSDVAYEEGHTHG